jgi:superfamily II DNA helicase RecQ
MPQDVIDLVMKTCRMDPHNTVKLLFTTNRPNLVYATIPMIGSIDNFANLHILLPSTFTPGYLFPKAIIFLDNKLKAASLARYMNSSLPPDLAKKEPFRHYHSGMSKPYLELVIKSFKEDNGDVRVLVATEAASNVSVLNCGI